ncbi:hypothetical protein BTK96_001654 [Burkholderia pyrrocinia]|uniref:hypothetical protein n=1 Tax=Burkholderia sp. IT-111MI5 TaxID=3026439 RepID=UPI002A2F0AEE|nr:hypothetical protein [Burkholderia pyrrocinia]EKS9894454.1 hypothetical protein [Burkholderia pyrrocinia]EKS9906747.1 hypothetical protein [Burkholderia pyrrocinia]
MKHGNGIRFATPGPALRRAERMHAPGANAFNAFAARVAATQSVAARRRVRSRLAVPFAAASVAIANAARFAGNHALAAAAATNACAIASGHAARSVSRRLAKRRPAVARAVPSMPSPARRRSLSSVRLTLMQDHSS